MAAASEAENRDDALALARLMRTLDELPKPTIARVHGAAFGGGVGLVACCDIAIGTPEAKFGLTESKLGLLPAVISPYVIAAIGARQARRWFATAEIFDAAEALRIGLLHLVVASDAARRRRAAPDRPADESGPRSVRNGQGAGAPRRHGWRFGDCRRCQRRTDRKTAGFARRPGRHFRFPRQAQTCLVRMKERPMDDAKPPCPIVNIADVELQPRPPAFAASGDAAQRFDARMGMVGTRIGARLLGYNITAVPPGKRAFPLHNHMVNEEMFFVLEGNGELRLGDATHPVRAGDIIALPAGRPGNGAPVRQYRRRRTEIPRRQHAVVARSLPVPGFGQVRGLRVRRKRETRRLALPPCRPRAGCAQLLGRRISDGARRAFRAEDVRENPHRQPRRDRLPRDPHRAPARHRARSRCIRRPTPTRSTCGRPTRPIRSAVRVRRIRTCAATRSSTSRGDPARRRSIRVTASSARTRISPTRSRRPGWRSSARRPHRCARWAARPAPRN